MTKKRTKLRTTPLPKASTITRGLIMPKNTDDALSDVQLDKSLHKTIEKLQQTALPQLLSLSRSRSAKEFHLRLALIILRSHRLTEQERIYLAELVETPWTGRKGRKGPAVKEDRHIAIFNKYIVAEVPWSKAVADIQTEYGLTEDAAKKAIKASKTYINSLVTALDNGTLGKF